MVLDIAVKMKTATPQGHICCGVHFAVFVMPRIRLSWNPPQRSPARRGRRPQHRSRAEAGCVFCGLHCMAEAMQRGCPAGTAGTPLSPESVVCYTTIPQTAKKRIFSPSHVGACRGGSEASNHMHFAVLRCSLSRSAQRCWQRKKGFFRCRSHAHSGLAQMKAAYTFAVLRSSFDRRQILKRCVFVENRRCAQCGNPLRQNIPTLLF